MKYDIFISYSHKDIEIVDRIEEELNLYGIKCFIDRSDIDLGDDFAEIISKALFESELMLFIWSESSNQSKNTANEIALAIEFGKQIIPFKIGKFEADYRLAYRLVRFNRIDVLTYNEQKVIELGEKIGKQFGKTKSEIDSTKHFTPSKARTESAEDFGLEIRLQHGIALLNDYKLSEAFDILYPLALIDYKGALEAMCFYVYIFERSRYLNCTQIERVKKDAENGILFSKFFYSFYLRLTQESYKHIMEAVDEGYAPAIWYLSLFYRVGVCVPMDENKERELREKSMNDGFILAKVEHVDLIRTSNYKSDIVKSNALLEEMASDGNGYAAYRLANFYSLKDRNIEKAKFYIDLAIKRGYKEAYYNLAIIEGEDENGNIINPEKYINALAKGAEFNEFSCISLLATSYLEGIGVKKNIKSGLRWLNKGIDLNSSDAMHILHNWYYYGYSDGELQINCEEAWKVAMKGAELDDPFCITDIANMCKNGDVFDGCTQNDCVEFYKDAANHSYGYEDASVELYEIYANGLFGESIDMGKAISYLKRAVDKGDIEACYIYGTLLADENYEYCNEFLAHKYLNIAAEQGKAEAYTALGILFETGFGVAQSSSEAKKMFETAVELGDDSAEKHLARLNGLVS